MEELGYEQEGVIRRAPDSPLDLPTAAPPLVGGWRDRAPRRMREVALPDAIVGLPDSSTPVLRMTERAARKLGSTPAEVGNWERRLQTIVGGEKSRLPLGLGLADIPLITGLPLYAMNAGERAGRDVAQGDYGSAALETALALGIPVVAARMMNRGAGVEDAIDRARRMNVGPRRGQMGAIAGPRALTADLAELERAKRAKAAGRPMDEIQARTGWRESEEPGKWFYEISDKDAKFDPYYALKRALPGTMNEVEVIDGALWLRHEGTYNGLDFDSQTLRDEFTREFGRPPSADMVQRAKNSTGAQLSAERRSLADYLNQPIKFETQDIFQHPELYAAYPLTRTIPYHMGEKMEPGIGGYFNIHEDPTRMGAIHSGGLPFTRGNVLRSGLERPDEKSLTLHELTHPTQQYERMDPGIAPETIRKHKNAYVNIKQANVDYAQAVEDVATLLRRNPGMSPDIAIDELLRMGAINPAYANDYATRSYIVGKAQGDPAIIRQELARAKADLANFKNKYPEVTKDQAMQGYLSNIGEAQARAVQARMNLTQDELRNRPFNLDYTRIPQGRRLFTEAELTDPNYVIDFNTMQPRPNQSTPVLPYVRSQQNAPRPRPMGYNAPVEE